MLRKARVRFNEGCCGSTAERLQMQGSNIGLKVGVLFGEKAKTITKRKAF